MLAARWQAQNKQPQPTVAHLAVRPTHRPPHAAAASTPPALAPLACAVRELYMNIFQPYGLWLRAVRLTRPSYLPMSRGLPDQKSLHVELSVSGRACVCVCVCVCVSGGGPGGSLECLLVFGDA